MSMIMTRNTRRRGLDHFEPESTMEPQEQRRLRTQLEQIDYAAFAANREIIGKSLQIADIARIERLAIAAAHARADWVAAALELADTGRHVSSEEGERLHGLRQTYEELAEAYEALRRMVERSYLPLKGKS